MSKKKKLSQVSVTIEDKDCFDNGQNFKYEQIFTAPVDGKYIINGKEFNLKVGDIIRKEDLISKP